jgi:hypothetical protein
MADMLRIDVDGGKYTVVQDEKGATHILRYGEPWMGQTGSFPGVNAVLAMAYELEELRSRPMATLEHRDVDEGIEMLREANGAFGNYTAPAPAVPEIGDEGRRFLELYAEGLASMAANMKLAAAKFKEEGNEMAALLIIRLQLSVEETGEWAEALASGDLKKAARELTDIQYVTDGHYLTLGLGDLKLPLYRAVHGDNMRKLGPDGKPIISEAGRWVKPEGWTATDLGSILEAPQQEGGA